MAGQDHRGIMMTEDLRKRVQSDSQGIPGYMFYGEEDNLYFLREDVSEAIQLPPAYSVYLRPHIQGILLKGARVFCFQEWDCAELVLHSPEIRFRGLKWCVHEIYYGTLVSGVNRPQETLMEQFNLSDQETGYSYRKGT